MCLQGIKLVTFDATNTLLKFRKPPWMYYVQTAQEQGFNVSPESMKDRLQKSLKIMSEKHPNFGRDDILWEKWWRQVVQQTLSIPAQADVEGLAAKLIKKFETTECWCLAEGSENLIKFLRKRGHSIGVISNFDPRLYIILRNVELNCFDFILTSYDVGYSKPSEQIFKLAMEKCSKSLNPSECLHIGDDIKKDYEGAKAAGWQALLISTNTKLNNPEKRCVFQNLTELHKDLEASNIGNKLNL